MKSKIIHNVQEFCGKHSDDICRYFAKNGQERKNFDDSFYVFNLGELMKMYLLYAELLPRVKPFFAVKSSPYEPLISALMELGSGFYCGSQDEFLQTRRLGVSPEKMIMANPYKQISHLKTAREHGVQLMVFDSESELQKLKKYHPTSRLVMRINVKEECERKYFSVKYGATITQARNLMLIAKDIDMNIVGVSFHIGALAGDNSGRYGQALKDARELFDFADEIKMPFKLLDIGGGLRVIDPHLRKITNSINVSLTELFSSSKYPDLKIISEPGGIFAESAFTLATNVVGKKEIKNSETAFHYYLNDGKFGSFLFLFESSKDLKYFFMSKYVDEKPAFHSRLWGPVLTGTDEIMNNALLPELDIGDWIFWRNLGAYSFACSSNFNGFKTKTFYNVITNKDRMLFQQLCKKTNTQFCFQTSNWNATEDKVLNGENWNTITE